MSKAREALARIAAIKDGTGSEFVEIDEARKIAREALAETEAAPAAPAAQAERIAQLERALERALQLTAPSPKPSQAEQAGSFELGRAHGITHVVDSLRANPEKWGYQPLSSKPSQAGPVQGETLRKALAAWDENCYMERAIWLADAVRAFLASSEGQQPANPTREKNHCHE